MRAVVHEEHEDTDHWWFRARRTIFARLLDRYVPRRPGLRILDLGPGGGVNLPVLSARGRVLCIDLDAGSLAKAGSRGADGARSDATRLPVRLRVLVAAVENSISGNAMRPLDVLETRAGISVEVG
ncbi:MAG: hypothetical protein AAFZ65_18440, partial [Planctomycetota bacterium]